MPAPGQKAKKLTLSTTSPVCPPKADSDASISDVAKVPKPAVSNRSKTALIRSPRRARARSAGAISKPSALAVLDDHQLVLGRCRSTGLVRGRASTAYPSLARLRRRRDLSLLAELQRPGLCPAPALPKASYRSPSICLCRRCLEFQIKGFPNLEL